MNTARISPTFTKEMEQIRSMKPQFFDRESLGYLPPLARLLFLGLYCRVDKEGRLQDKPRTIKKAILGYDDVTAGQVDGMLQELHNAGLIIRYQAKGSSFIQVVDFGAASNQFTD
ncbi:conserved hypothetical protein [Heliomicrobium modesticaldum Ice1]|uniref:Uncharacterized protein n=1 Tax=Heliobacterium modesticaldum (strain ATCC 51547 / Ice1) TaxID=498761 RepID=B0THY8_HELMI|nr:hypothetical protein [Heliomicrobium modesticaldum]ABZ82661.1 conserved hypothetical protein [Heliomicrobium modesticaldum Ice1]